MSPGWVLLATLGAPAQAHEQRPSLLELDEQPGGVVEARFAVAFARGVPLPLVAELPERCAPVGPVEQSWSSTARTTRWSVDCGAEGLGQGPVAVQGLGEAGTDVLLRVRTADDQRHSAVLSASRPSWRPPSDPTRPPAPTWPATLSIGLRHILEGPDHLLFVLGLVLLLHRRWRGLLQAITGFTLGHSLTLALVTLGVVRSPGLAAEALIAGSVLLLAVELAAPDGGKQSLTAARPLLVSTLCGLAHGLGFAGALATLGLATDDVGITLLLFNLGVELGQLAFVAALLLAALGLSRLPERPRQLGRLAVVWAMGVVSSAWLLDRLGQLVG